MRRTVLLTCLLVALGAPCARAAQAASELEAVPAPRALLAGRVLLKDGVTPVRGADLVLTGEGDGSAHRTRSGRSGRYRVRLPAGRYTLRIQRRLEIFTSPSLYQLPAGGRLEVDFLLLPDFEPEQGGPEDGTAAEPPAGSRGPAPRLESARVVGSVVDMIRSSGKKRTGRWGEALGFIGSILAVALAAI
ncbi:MAG: carboxypeptidase-like regulatory domain-containing protein [Planctomycetota bacterium]